MKLRAPERSPAWTENFLAVIVDSSDDAVIGKTLEGTIVSWNRGAERIYGYTAEEAIGRPISILIPPERPDELPAIMDRLSRGERIDHYQAERVHKDGSRLTVSVTISPIRDETGVIIGASAIARDITETQRAVDEALRAREDFISIAAHELRTPLTALYARVQLAERRIVRGGEREDVVHQLTEVREAADRMRVLLERLLDLSRLRSGSLEIERQEVDLAALVGSIATALGTTAGREITMRTSERPGATCAMVDEVRIEEVVVNLLDNAIKYSPPETPIEVDVETLDGSVVVAVRDHGNGIADQDRDRIFEPFRRGTEGGRGVGLGLHVAREIVQRHGGSIVVDRPEGGGSRFVVTLPKR